VPFNVFKCNLRRYATAVFDFATKVGTGGLCRAGTYLNAHAPMLAKVPKYIAKVPKI
jgi:hypothetical protein